MHKFVLMSSAMWLLNMIKNMMSLTVLENMDPKVELRTRRREKRNSAARAEFSLLLTSVLSPTAAKQSWALPVCSRQRPWSTFSTAFFRLVMFPICCSVPDFMLNTESFVASHCCSASIVYVGYLLQDTTFVAIQCNPMMTNCCAHFCCVLPKLVSDSVLMLVCWQVFS